MQMIKYPYSNLTRHHSCYLMLVDTFFKSMYKFFSYVTIEEKCIVIEIYNVYPFKIYNPSNFDPSYKVKTIDDDFDYITYHDVFQTFYLYMPDIVPYIEVELHELEGGEYFERFNFRNVYYTEEQSKVYLFSSKKITDNVFF